MLERRVVVRLNEGLHARPATQFVKLARAFSADLEISCAGKSANAKSAVKLMLLGVKEADEIVLRASGPDETQALQALADFVAAKTPVEGDTPATPTPAAAARDAAGGSMLRGAPASEGAAIGPVFAYFREELTPPRRVVEASDIDTEFARLRRALEAIEADLARRATIAAPDSEEAAIVAALGDIGRDDEFVRRIEERVRSGSDAVTSVLEAGDDLARAFEALTDPYMRARAEDVRAIARHVALALLGKKDVSLSEAPPGSVIVAEEITAFDLVGVSLAALSGLVCAKGGATSHIAIIARSHALPAVLGLSVDLATLRAARHVALDGSSGEVAFDPDPATRARFRARIDAAAREAGPLQDFVKVEPRTREGRRIEVAANIGSLKEIDAALAVGAMGVGLFRTELMFMERKRPPTEDEQAVIYEKLVKAFAPYPVIVRTLDIGGDKPTPGLVFPHEDNPFLGWRGVRFCLDRPDVFKPQLRALLRAAAHGDLKVMAPMIAEVEEVRQVKRLIQECAAELTAEGVAHRAFPLGVMVETPAAALLAEDLAAEAAFFSIGTNDLTQYVMAADRLNPRVAHLNRADHPAVLKAVDMICRAAAKAGVWVGVCGEAAARPDLIARFLAMGVSELSMSPASILRAKKRVTEI